MKKKLFAILKILLPLGVGIYLILFFYNALSEEDKEQVFIAFKKADYTWILLSVFLSFLTFVIRAFRWRYLLRPMGYEVSFAKCYHAVMFGYLLNMVIPRAGEPGRAGVLYKKANVPFQKGFGTIIAERAIDMLLLAAIGLITLYFQWRNLDLIQSRVNLYTQSENASEETSYFWIVWIILGVLAALGIFLLYKKRELRIKIIEILKGLWEGIISIRNSKSLLPFIFFSLLIWGLYILMFWVCFYSMEETAQTPAGGIMAAFIAGTIGIIFVQGGIGVFPALVGIVVTTYLFTNFEQPIHPIGFALGWVIWLSQTVSIVSLGLISLIWLQKSTPNESTQQNTK